MEAYATALLYAIPFFVLLLIIEIAYGHFVKDQKHKLMDSISSLSSGLTNSIKDSLGLGVIIISYPFLLEHLALLEIKASWGVWLVAFVAIDFAGYWNHRLSHHINFFWNQHVIHHSSEEFNLACALRQPVSNLLGYFALLLVPAAILGVPAEVIAILAPIHLFAQFWYHSQHIGKLGWLEYVIVTPSQHRVHHAINKEYIDKNLGQILCIWDRWFGTFQEELEDVPPQYGVLKPAQTWNPILINFQHLWLLIKDAWRTRSLKDKFRIWWMPTGWRPEDVKSKYPVPIIEDVYHYEKYAPEASLGLKLYSLLQFTATLALMMFMFYNYNAIGFTGLLGFGGFLFLGIFSYTSLMDGSRWAGFLETLRGLLGLGVLWVSGDWFGIAAHWGWATSMLYLYFLLTAVGGMYFSYLEKRVLPGRLAA